MDIKQKFSDDAPDNVTDMSQKMAWSFGYNAALNDIIDAFKANNVHDLNRIIKEHVTKAKGPIGDIVHVPDLDLTIERIAEFDDIFLELLRKSLGPELVSRFNCRNSNVTTGHLLRVVGLPQEVQLNLLIRAERESLTVFQLLDLVKEYRATKKD